MLIKHLLYYKSFLYKNNSKQSYEENILIKNPVTNKTVANIVIGIKASKPITNIPTTSTIILIIIKIKPIIAREDKRSRKNTHPKSVDISMFSG